ncbi:Signal transduction histidine kinase [Psychroflexus salarius]|uniref:histidine kinase n=1 Tax=Psychroflexus salarius TaxID=1155689 RepID=A0A1M4UYQ7_9FLAO|nr:tetratricopeptide repeat protein [Psychroflexus salarius]SHE61799.1 Signal transduction histidine kinase [Psychroflexus salarius]
MKVLSLLIFLSLFWACHRQEPEKVVPKNLAEAIQQYQSTHDKTQQFQLLNKAKQLIIRQPDSIQNLYLSQFAYDYLKLGNTFEFKQLNQLAFKKAKAENNWFKLGDVEWNYASYYNNLQVYDSAFYHFKEAKVYFTRADNHYHVAQMLYGMAFIKSRFRDYSGTENLIFEALNLLNNQKEYQSFYYSCYSLLSVLSKDKGDYRQALGYQEQALDYLDDSSASKNKQIASLNNIGIIYHETGQYQKAINRYKEALAHEALQLNTNLHAKLLDNLAYSQLKLGDTSNVLKSFNQALEIREGLKNASGIVINTIHLAQYYDVVNQPQKAILLAEKAKDLAKDIENPRDYLGALKLLASLDQEHANAYLNQYISYNDSINSVERDNQNKFMRIAYETDQYKAKTKQLSQQNLQLIIVGLSFFVVITLVYFIRNQFILKEKLALENDIQNANQEVYLLTIKRQLELEKERLLERNRIAEDLHDGVLSKLFATRLNLSYLPVNPKDNNLDLRENYLNELQQIEQEIRDVSHTLSYHFSDSELGFSKALELLIKDKAKIAQLKTQIKIEGQEQINQLSQEQKVNIYRILQEALQNIIKHANASLICIEINCNLSHLDLLIQDNGKGINTNLKNGIGLKNMRSRAKKINGQLHIENCRPKGTQISIYIRL